MVCEGGLSRDYVATISGGMDKVHFLESIPWLIDAGVQELAPFLRALKFDSPRRVAGPVDLPADSRSRPNGALKLAFGPLHRVWRDGLVSSWRSLRKPKAADGAVRPPILLCRERSRRT
jgi:hypothetical protein